MIGQKKLLNTLKTSKLPHFIILVSPQGSGKKMVARYIAKLLSATYATCGIKVDEVRETIDTAMHVTEKMLYCIEDADNMSLMAKNALLKITEEPPENAYFVMTVQNDGSVLGTIKSRGTVIHLDPYTPSEIREYLGTIQGQSDYDIDLACDIATTPYQAELLFRYGKDFTDYVNLVIDNIAEVEPANAFKSSKKLAFKNEEDKYDVTLFWTTFCMILSERIQENPLKFARGIEVTAPYTDKSRKVGTNLQQLYDSWVFKIREAWL